MYKGYYDFIEKFDGVAGIDLWHEDLYYDELTSPCSSCGGGGCDACALVCPNCGHYPLVFGDNNSPNPADVVRYVECPDCHWREEG